MADFIATLSTGEGTWGHVQRIINQGEFAHVYLIMDQFGKEKFTAENPFEAILIDSDRSTLQLVEDIRIALEGKIKDIEVALNLISGTGKEHMALLSALLKLGLGFRLVVLTKEGIEEL